MDVFSTLKAMPNKLLNKDGSITDFKGNIITPADPNLADVYNRSKAIANKFLNSDDEVKTYAEISLEIFEVVDVLPEIGEKNKISSFCRFHSHRRIYVFYPILILINQWNKWCIFN